LARTNRQVRGLRVEATADRIRVHGITSRYYIKQLVLAAIREVAGIVAVDLNIQVRTETLAAGI